MMSIDRPDDSEAFLGRWSRLKTEAREAPAPAARPPAKADAKDPLPDLPPVEKLTLDSDFSGFFHPKVDEDMRRAALRKLFSDPHFNVMDGLDVYIDDYSKSEPIPAAMMAGLRQAQRILDWAANKEDEAEAETAPQEANSGGLEAGSTGAVPALEESASSPQREPVSQSDGVPSEKT